MCEPASAMAAVGAALSIAGSVASNRQQARAYSANASAANRAVVNSYAGAGLRQQQEQQKAAQDKFDVGLQMAEAKSTATVAAGESGVGGISFANLLSDYEARAGRTNATTDANAEMAVSAVQADKESTQAKGQSAINAMPRPSPLGLFADVGAQAARAGLRIYDTENPPPNRR